MPWALAALLAMVASGAVGLLMQQLFLRWNQGQELRQALITIAVSLILADQMLAHFGGTADGDRAARSSSRTPAARCLRPRLPDVPHGDPGRRDHRRPAVLAGPPADAGGHGGARRRRRHADDARRSASTSQRVFAVAFFVGSALAGLGGAFAGTTLSLAPGQDQAFLVSALVVVIVGGMGSLGGAALGALLLGLVDQYSSAYLPAEYTNSPSCSSSSCSPSSSRCGRPDCSGGRHEYRAGTAADVRPAARRARLVVVALVPLLLVRLPHQPGRR